MLPVYLSAPFAVSLPVSFLSLALAGWVAGYLSLIVAVYRAAPAPRTVRGVK